MAADGQVVFEIQGDNRALRDTLNDTTNAIQRESRQWDNAVSDSSDKMSNAFTGALKSMSAAAIASQVGKALLDFGKEAINAASDLAEVQNVVDTTFGESASEIDRWAKNAITQFGLTETQAKKFASTMGAMMKSSGVASKDITMMSENLAGLAADMSSFYNLDFEEAFNKIRSGISGETEPLKQLGINMSVANLEAFALSQGLKKTFNEMTQGEQIMLRYQYIMQATSDAQGDFSRTSDGFANGLRLLQSNFESLKTTVGTLFIPVVNQALEALNKMFAVLIPAEKKTTVLDDFASIDLQTEEKIKDIESTKEKALELVGIIKEIESTTITSKIDLSGIAQGANLLESSASGNWSGFISSLSGVDGVITAAGGGKQAGDDLKGLASGGAALTGESVTGFKYDKLPEKIQTLLTKAGLVPTAVGQLQNLDDEGKELTGTEETGFKYKNLPGDIGSVEDAASDFNKTGKLELDKFDKNLADYVKEGSDKFKYASLDKSILGFVETAGKTSDVPGNLAKIDEGAQKVTGTDKSDFKYEKLREKIIGFVDTSKTTDNLETNLDKVNNAADKVTGTSTAQFKYTGLQGDINGFVQTADSVSSVPGDMDTLVEGAKKVTGSSTEGFKYDGVTKGVEGLVSAADSVVNNDTSGDIGTLTGAADTLTGDGEGFKYADVTTGVTDLVGAANSTETDGTKGKLENVGSGASGLAGTDEGFKYESVANGIDDLKTNAQGGTTAGTELTDLADGAAAVAGIQYDEGKDPIGTLTGKVKLLKSTDANNWTRVLSVFQRVPGIGDKLDNTTIGNIASAFNGLEGDKATAWQTLMNALGSDLSALSTLTGTDENSAAQWLSDMKEAANGLNPGDVDAWDALLTLLANGTPGAGNFMNFSEIYQAAEAMGVADSMYVQLDGRTVSLTEANRMYLESLKRLVQTYPELSDMINTETGEIKGGTTALEERITKIAEQREAEALLYGVQQKRLALEKKFGELPSLRVDAALAQNAVKAMREEYDKALARLKEIGAYQDQMGNWVVDDLSKQEEVIQLVETVIDKYEELVDASDAATKAYEDQQNAYDEASKKYDELEKETKELAKAQEDGADAAVTYTDAQKKAATDGVQALADALKDVNDYIEKTRKSTEDSIDSTLKGFKDFETGAQYIERLKKEQKAAQEKELKKQIDKANKTGKVNIDVKLTGAEDTVPTLNKMTTALENQKKFLEEYNNDLAKAREYGLSDEFLSQFSDVSQENAGYLHLIAQGGKEAAQKLQAAFDDVKKEEKKLVDPLTELKLKTDDTFNELINKAKEAAVKLNNEDVAKASMAATVEGIAKGIQEKVSEVKSAVDALNAELARMGDVSGMNLFDGLNNGFSFTFTGSSPDHLATGLDYVPYNNYLSYLHEGEAVLTAEEAAIWRNFKNGGISAANSIDYGRMAGAIWDQAPNMGGNVYLDGTTVGRLISAQQANAVRTLERSGWRG